MVSNLGVTIALDLNASCGGSGAPRIGDNWDLQPSIFFSTKVGQSDVTKFHRKSDIPMIWKGIFKFAQWVRGPKLVLYKWV